MTDLVGRTISKRYRVDAFLGKGGMSEVYKVWDLRLTAYLAMKILSADLAEDKIFQRRFRREAQTLNKLQHPNIVRFYGLEQDEGLVFMLMDYVEGTTLRKEIYQSKGPFSLKRVLEIMRPVCSALNYAHQSGYIHCDVKPANIMIHANGTVLVSDFGIARVTESATATMVGAGTPAYMAPEQARGENPTPQTDIYALGVVLFEMLTGGERPFTGEHARTTGSTGEKIRWEQLNLEPPSLRKLSPTVTPDLEAVVKRCLEKSPDRRFTSTQELLNALTIAISGMEKETKPRANPPSRKKMETRPLASLPFQASTKRHTWLHQWGWIPALGIGLGLIVTIIVSFNTQSQQDSLQLSATPSLEITPQPTLTLTQIPTDTRRPTVANTNTPNYDLEKTFTVSAKELWQNTGIELLPGDIVNIQYLSGQWGWTGDLPPEAKGANGSSRSCLNVAGSSVNDCPIPNTNEGALIARVGNNSFFVGERMAYTVPAGEINHSNLELRMNDGDGGMYDNFGSIEVKVSIIHIKITVQIEVIAVKGWQASEITVQSGQSLRITYLSGKWSACAPPYGCPFTDAMGDPTQAGSPDASKNYADNIIHGCYHGSLIARVGSGSPFCVGLNYSQTIQSSGKLELSINDKALSDEGGEITVLIEVR